MKVLFIGGSGNISSSVSKLAVEKGIDLYLLNRGNQKGIPGTGVISGDITSSAIISKLKNEKWDAVVNWIAYNLLDVERDIRLFSGKTKQYIFISSASAYQKPLTHPVITESTPLANPFWEYSRRKIACEERLMRAYRDEGFPSVIVRPSHTYDTMIPSALYAGNEYNLIDRLLHGRKVIVHGDGTSLWVLTHAEDFAKGFVGLIGNQQTLAHAFHITSDELLNWDQIHATIAEALGVEANIIHIPSDFICGINSAHTGDLLGDKTYSVIFDNTKIKTFVPGYNATIPFMEGIRRTLKWFDENPERKIINQVAEKNTDRIIEAYESKKG
ncbi:MAG: SDR family oxidoreductase [Bacteroidales bacterium]|nr:SDR family oxidoreductase [Bacteroidales bacterium]